MNNTALTNLLILIGIGIAGWSLLEQINTSKGVVRVEEKVASLEKNMTEVKSKYSKIEELDRTLIAMKEKEKYSNFYLGLDKVNQLPFVSPIHDIKETPTGVVR